MMQVWVIANQKGGVGKTTTALTLAGLSAQAGQRVLIADLDPQGSASHYLGLADAGDLHESAGLLMKEQGVTPVATSLPNVDLFVGGASLATIERRAPANGQGLMFKRALQTYRERYDRIIVDTPPSLGTLLINALVSATRIIIPVQTEPLAVHGARQLLRTLQMLSAAGTTQVPRIVVPTMHDARTRSARETLEELQEEFGDTMWNDLIPIDTRLRDASRSGKILCAESDQLRAAGAYKKLINALDPTVPGVSKEAA